MVGGSRAHARGSERRLRVRRARSAAPSNSKSRLTAPASGSCGRESRVAESFQRARGPPPSFSKTRMTPPPSGRGRMESVRLWESWWCRTSVKVRQTPTPALPAGEGGDSRTRLSELRGRGLENAVHFLRARGPPPSFSKTRMTPPPPGAGEEAEPPPSFSKTRMTPPPPGRGRRQAGCLPHQQAGCLLHR